METVISQEQWEAWAEEGTWSLLPCAVRKPVAGGLPADWTRAWEEARPYSFVLESGKTGRYTFLGLNPVSVIRGKGNRAVLTETASGETVEWSGTPLQLLKQWMGPWKSPVADGLPKFCGGAVGFLGYDVARSLERLPRMAKDDLELDDYVWMRFEEIWVWDETEKFVYAVVHSPVANEPGMDLKKLYTSARDRAMGMADRWERFCRRMEEGSEAPKDSEEQSGEKYQAPPAGPDPLKPPAEAGELVKSDALPGCKAVSMPQEAFEAAVRRVQDYIAAGDVFQVNLSLRQAFEVQSSPEAVYECLRRINPSPYMGLLRLPDFQLVSASPELLVKVERGRISTRPIAGTRRRGHTAEEDALMEAELTGSEKERAEHIMLVDLLRNDLGRVAVYGSVRVSELFTIERYSHVMHLVSEVEGALPADKTAYDAIAAVFPGGTITGAPKVRTMEIIEELEPVTRGPYTGSMGWIDYNGNMELNIIIRTLVVKDGVGYIQAGAGIVIDSVPYREYRECSNKARAVAAAVRQSELTAVHGEGQGMK